MKFTEIHVKPFVNITSSYDYFVEVLYKENGKPEKHGKCFCRTFHLNTERFMANGSQPGYIQMPLYVVNEVLSQLRKLIEADKLEAYEYNQNGEKRWENLRYYDRNELLTI